MSMFRKPGEDSSSSSDDSYELTEDDEPSTTNQDNVLSRIRTLESATSERSNDRPQPPRLDIRQNSSQNVRDLMLHALLEEKAINEAAQQLGKDISDPEVQRRGREVYQELARQISNNVDDTYASDELRDHRAAAQAGISKLTKSNLNRLAVVPEGAVSNALVARPTSGAAMGLPMQPSTNFDILSGISVPAALSLRGYPDLQTDRYAREFSELDVVGKGGYGKVFKARHKLDGFIYAVKRIPVSPTKLARVQEHGPEELESMLEEVRSLARFEHMNVVRYHNAWLEFTTTSSDPSVLPAITLIRNDRLIEGGRVLSSSPATTEELHARFDDLSFGDPFRGHDNGDDGGIIFENSDNGVGTDAAKIESDNLSFRAQLRKSSKRRLRRGSQASQATIATISSTKSRMSAVEDVDEEDDEDEEIETIPRSHMAFHQETVSGLSEGMISHSDVPGHLVPMPTAGPILTLNVQMSLCETNLATFLSVDRNPTTSPPTDSHCFHPCISLELLQHIVSGVEYLHAQGVVHRDLKPANVFLSLSNGRHSPYGSVDVSTCTHCPKRNCLHVTPRIGDFGLVAALSDTCVDTNQAMKPVGTEFYRPDATSRVNEKLDVFALGVIGFEMLQKFGTRMERIAALTDIRRGRFPDSFLPEIGAHRADIQQLIKDMVHMDEEKRLGCEEVKQAIAQLVMATKS